LLSAKGYRGHWGPAYAMLEMADLTGQPKPLAVADEVVEFMLHRATRTSDGGLDHFSGKPELWVDTLDMCCPVLVTKARLAHRPELQAEARRQLEIFARHLQDPATGLFYHHWSETTGRRTTNFWARGNGWVVLASLETLRHESPESAAAKPLRERLGKQMASIIKLQDPATGLWHTVLDAPDTYVETSASAMFLHGMVEGQRLKLIDPPSRACLKAAWRGLARQVDATGQVVGTSGGTGPSSKEAYARIRTGSYNYGTGAFLLAACSWARTEAASATSLKPGS
ncbi:MAG: glycoside hydrolase family 88 protein, partial [Candidatus Bipolaricaulota bacterium]|nr:glycoside hydrolase family 88 protein [Candidatus Bipolaricaulota bacterium]